MTGHRNAILVGLWLMAGCDADVAASAESMVSHDASAEVTPPADSSAGNDSDAASIAPFEAPRLTPPDAESSEPYYLSQTGLYLDTAQTKLAPDLLEFEPRFALWSDGADKRRWLRLPHGTSVDSQDPDHWQLPVGAVLYKEFARDGKRLETRVIARLGPGADDYFMGAFVWREDQSDAELTREGVHDVLGTSHDVPAIKSCGTCHNGEPGRVLGLSAVQHKNLPLTALSTPLPKLIAVPGSPSTVEALGYLHANCGHCHNPTGSARPDTDMNLRLASGSAAPEETTIYLSTLGVKLQYFQGDGVALRVRPGLPDESGLLVRMQQRGARVQMPPLASEQVDAQGVMLVRRWIADLTAE
jgi:hypothetical protein